MKYYPEGSNETLAKRFETTAEIKEAISNGDICEAKVLMCDSEHNLHLDLGIVRGIIPRCEGALGIDTGQVRDIALISKVNRFVSFKIEYLQRDDNGEVVAYLSRKSAQQEAYENYISKLKVGDIADAVVTHLEQFGAFIDIGCGINALIPIDMLSVSRISHPSQRISQGQKIRAVLRKKEGEKLTFSLRELLGTWTQNAENFKAGETVTGIVRSIENYGVFVELAPNLAGLAEPCDNLFESQKVSVFIKSVIENKMKIKLVIVDAFEKWKTPEPLVFYEEKDHIDVWKYSPQESRKEIFTVFDAE